MLTPIRRQVSDPLSICLCDDPEKIGQEAAPVYPSLLCQFTDGRLRSGPYDGVDGRIIAKDVLLIPIDVDPSNQSRFIDSEIIEKGTVLPVMVGIVGIIHATLLISEEQQFTRLKLSL